MNAAAAQQWAVRCVPPPGTRVAIVGGCGGIGRAAVHACRELDHRVAVLDLPQSIAAHAPADVEQVIGLDATSADQVETAFARLSTAFGALDSLLFLVGFTLTPPRPAEQIDVAAWDAIVRGNLTSAHLVMRAALPLLKRGQSASAVLVSSGLGVSVLPGFGPYAAAKAGVIALTKTLAFECAPSVRINAVAPGAIHTDFMKGGLGRGDSDGSWFDPTPHVRGIPLQRLAQTDDVVGPLLFLGSPAARFITGQTLHVNGGRYMP